MSTEKRSNKDPLETKDFGCQASVSVKKKKSKSKVSKLRPLNLSQNAENQSFEPNNFYNYPNNYLPNIIPVAMPSQY